MITSKLLIAAVCTFSMSAFGCQVRLEPIAFDDGTLSSDSADAVRLAAMRSHAATSAVFNPMAPLHEPVSTINTSTIDAIRPQPLSTLTFNMEHRDKPAQLAAMAKRLKSDLTHLPDFILMQEVVFNRNDKKGRKNTAAVLADELNYYCQGTKRTSDREGIAIASRYPFDYYAERHLKSQTSRLLLGFRRVSVMGEFIVPAMGRVRVVNVHFTNWGFERHVRAKQLKETLEWIAVRQHEVPAEITILGGDFNIEPDWSELNLVGEAATVLNLDFQDFNTDDPTRGSRGRPHHRVDYMFVCAPACDVRMNGERRLFMDGLTLKPGGSKFHLSDHVPVLHDYSIITPAQPTFAGVVDPN